MKQKLKKIECANENFTTDLLTLCYTYIIQNIC